MCKSFPILSLIYVKCKSFEWPLFHLTSSIFQSEKHTHSDSDEQSTETHNKYSKTQFILVINILIWKFTISALTIINSLTCFPHQTMTGAKFYIPQEKPSHLSFCNIYIFRIVLTPLLVLNINTVSILNMIKQVIFEFRDTKLCTQFRFHNVFKCDISTKNMIYNFSWRIVLCREKSLC